MNPAERHAMEEVFSRASGTQFQVDLLGLESDGGQATLDFNQSYISMTSPAADRALDRLRAEFSRAPDGSWIIQRMAPRTR
jgi:hypothetical protein